MGFDAWLFCRIDIADLINRYLNQGMEMVWHAS